MKTKIRLLLTDDHAVMRAALADMLNSNPAFHVVAQANDCASTLKLYQDKNPDVVLLDVALPEIDGVEILRRLRAQNPQAHVLMLSSSDAEEDIVHSFHAGAAGYVSKTAEPAELIAAILSCHAGERVLSPMIARRLAEHSAGSPLTERELEVLALLRKGLNNPDIAQLLKVSRHTVKAHIRALLVKLEAVDRTEAVVRAFERGLLKL